ncbi:AraC-type DNA-binding protein [Brevibacterium aurantiacum]|uniref:AraC-type DNA-binding protein n=2 Tax=Brevibacterium aurantiacum TaxID=273384 RepID=A0A2H1IUK5_BREAU|nr:AraC-type DNA-binding protein [Brevibacterium aurantiacum]
MGPSRQFPATEPLPGIHHQHPQRSPTDQALGIPAARLDPQIHAEHHEVAWQVRGRSQMNLEGKIIELAENDALWIPAGLTHSAQVHPDSVIFPYFFPVDDTATVLDDASLAHLHHDETIYFLALKQMTTTIIHSRINLARQVLSILEHRILGGDELPRPRTPAAAAVAEALLFNPGDDRTIAQWAGEVHASVRSLERAFLRDTGLTLRQWRLHTRMNAARSLLATGASIASVSHRVGYTSPNSFTRAFRTFFGATPSQFRQQNSPPSSPVGHRPAALRAES